MDESGSAEIAAALYSTLVGFHGEIYTKTTMPKRSAASSTNARFLVGGFGVENIDYLKVVDGLQGVDAGNAAILETKQQVLYNKGCVLSIFKGRV